MRGKKTLSRQQSAKRGNDRLPVSTVSKVRRQSGGKGLRATIRRHSAATPEAKQFAESRIFHPVHACFSRSQPPENQNAKTTKGISNHAVE
jgi:hypothetical protein